MQTPVDALDRYARRIDFLLKFYKFIIMEDKNERERKESTCGERKSRN